MRHRLATLLAYMILLAVGTLSSAGAAISAVVFNNFGPNGAVQNAGTWMGTWGEEKMLAVQSFTPSATGKITKIEAAMRRLDPTAPNQITLKIIPSAGSVPPTANLIWSQTFTGAFGASSPNPSFNIDNGPVLQAGVRYWLYVDVPSYGRAPYVWWDGLVGNDATAWYFETGPRANTWTIFDPLNSPGRAMRVTALIPEPATLATLFLGTAFRRRR